MNNVNNVANSFMHAMLRIIFGGDNSKTTEDMIEQVIQWRDRLKRIEEIVNEQSSSTKEVSQGIYSIPNVQLHGTFGTTYIGRTSSEVGITLESAGESTETVLRFKEGVEIDKEFCEICECLPCDCSWGNEETSSPHITFSLLGQVVAATDLLKAQGCTNPSDEEVKEEALSNFITMIGKVVSAHPKSMFRYVKVKTRLKGKMVGRGEDRKRVNDAWVEYTFDLHFEYKKSLVEALANVTNEFSGILGANNIPDVGLEYAEPLSINEWQCAYIEQMDSWRVALKDPGIEENQTFKTSNNTIYLNAHVCEKVILEKAEHTHYTKTKHRSGVTAIKSYLRKNFHIHNFRTIDLSSIQSITFIKE